MKAVRWLNNNFEEVLLIALMVGITAVLVLQIVMRYVFSNSLSWAEEVSRYMLVWSGFLSISWTLRKASAMRLDLLNFFLPKIAIQVIALITQVIMLVFFVYMDIQAFELLPKIEQTSAALLLPMKYVYVSINIGFTLTIIRLVQLIFATVKSFFAGTKEIGGAAS